jgi:hypothetical protein
MNWRERASYLKDTQLMSVARFLLLGAIALTGCRSAQKAAVTTFRVIDAPAHYIRERIDQNETTTTTTTTTVSDVENPGQPVASPAPRVTHHEVSNSRRTTASAETSAPASRKSSASAPPKSSPAPTSFPTAKPVPGKPGYVYSIDPKGGIVDVTGYKSGDKAKDPYTKQIFIVP